MPFLSWLLALHSYFFIFSLAHTAMHTHDMTTPGLHSHGHSRGQQIVYSLYVGDLDPEVTDLELNDLFKQTGQVISVKVCRDRSTRRSLGYGYVNYSNAQDAAKALYELNFTPPNGKPIRIMYYHRDPTIRKSGAGNIFIKNLDKSIDYKALYDTFSTFGNILSCKVATDLSGQSKGYGFVQFDNEESAKNAIDKLNGTLLKDKQVFVGPFLRKQERETTTEKTKFNNVYAKNLSESTTDDDLMELFGVYGTIISAVVKRDAAGKSKCVGFVNFKDPDDAARSVEALNGKKFDGKELYVTKDKFEGLNLFVKNLDDIVTDDKLKELFSEFGTITSCKVMLCPNGISRGYGFVAFSTAEEASRALAEMNGKTIVSKPLYVALAQLKEERIARLQAQFAQMHPGAMGPTVATRTPMYPPGAPGLGQQLDQGPAIIPPQPEFGYRQQLVPGIKPHPFVLMVPTGQQGQRPGGRRSGAGRVQQTQQPLTVMQRQLPEPRMPLVTPTNDVDGMPFRDATSSQPMQAGIFGIVNALHKLLEQEKGIFINANLGFNNYNHNNTNNNNNNNNNNN